ncbi:MAG: hypothetical protein ACKO3T_25605 [Planctomycetaceae bacterium]
MKDFGIALLVLACCCGCSNDLSSRWAMDDPEYAERYGKPYPGNDLKKLGRKLKQSSDARHLADSSAVYFGAGASDAPFTAGADVGLLRYSSDSIEQRIGFRGLAGTGDRALIVGVDTGMRFHLPTRFSPFVGVGVFGGGWRSSVPAEDDDLDNDDDNSIDEDGEREYSRELYAAVYPEIGINWWVSPRSRATLSVQHHFSTAGRDDDYTFFGLTLASRAKIRDPDLPDRNEVPEISELAELLEQPDPAEAAVLRDLLQVPEPSGSNE